MKIEFCFDGISNNAISVFEDFCNQEDVVEFFDWRIVDGKKTVVNLYSENFSPDTVFDLEVFDALSERVSRMKRDDGMGPVSNNRYQIVPS